MKLCAGLAAVVVGSVAFVAAAYLRFLLGYGDQDMLP